MYSGKYCFFFSNQSTLWAQLAVKRSHYSNALCYIHHFQSACSLRSRSSFHTVFCFRSGCSCILPNFIVLLRSAAPVLLFGNLPSASNLAAALTPFSNAVIGSPIGGFIYFPLLRHALQGIATLGGYAAVASLCRRSSSDAPAPALHSVCRSTRPTLLG